MATSTIIDKKELANFTTLPLGKNIISTKITTKKVIRDSYDVRRNLRKERLNSIIPSGHNHDTKTTSVDLKQKEYKTEKALLQKRRDLINAVKITSAKWSKLEKDEKKFRKCFIQFNEYVKKCAEKRNRYLLRSQYHHANFTKRSREIQILNLEIERCRIIKLLLKMERKKHSIYYDYLKQVVDHSCRFMTVQDLLKSFEIVLHSLERTTNNYKRTIQELDEKQDKIKYLIVDKNTKVLDLHLRMNYLSKMYEELCCKNMENEKLVMSVCSKIHESIMEYEECLKNINGLYNQICRRWNMKQVFAKNDYENQIFFIKTILGPKQIIELGLLSLSTI